MNFGFSLKRPQPFATDVNLVTEGCRYVCTGGMERQSCVRGKHEQLKEPLLLWDTWAQCMSQRLRDFEGLLKEHEVLNFISEGHE